MPVYALVCIALGAQPGCPAECARTCLPAALQEACLCTPTVSSQAAIQKVC